MTVRELRCLIPTLASQTKINLYFKSDTDLKYKFPPPNCSHTPPGYVCPRLRIVVMS